MPRGSRRFRGRLLAPLLALLLSVVIAAPVRGDDIQDKKKQKDQENSLIASLQSQIAATQNREVQVQALIAAIDSQLQATQARINVEQGKLDAIALEVARMQAHLRATIAKLNADKTALATETKVIYEQSNQSTPVNNIIGAHSFNDFFVKLLDARRVATQEQKLVDTVFTERTQAEDEVLAITAKQADQKVVVAQLGEQRRQQSVQRGAQRQLQQQLQVLIAQDQQRMVQAEAASKALDAEIAALVAAQEAAARQNNGNGGGGGGNGRFSWPMSGGISQGFGCTPYYFEPYDPSCPSRHFHTGLDIANSCGTPVHAGDGGIAYAYYSNWGFGDHVIIVHGNGWTSVYGHLGNIAVGNGQGVGRGQYIGNEGSSGNSTGCHLHFEIRYNGTPRNPYDYLP